MSLDKTLFKNKTFSDVLEEVYNNSRKKEKTINSLIGELKPLIENIGDATIIVPLIASYLEIGVKNDKHLIDMLAVAQRMENAAAKGDAAGFELGAEELAQILEGMDDLTGELDQKSQEEPTQE
jgi:hypothetical protein